MVCTRRSFIPTFGRKHDGLVACCVGEKAKLVWLKDVIEADLSQIVIDVFQHLCMVV
jgi:hypothetical protein